MKPKPNADHAPEARPQPMRTRPRAPCTRWGFRPPVLDEDEERRVRKKVEEAEEVRKAREAEKAERAEKAEKGGGK
jgi:hypothetical protein